MLAYTCQPEKTSNNLHHMKSEPITRDGRGVPYDKKVLRRKRMAAGLSQARLAELAQVSTSLVSALECGVSGASPATLLAIATTLGCTAEELMTEPQDGA